MRKNLITGLAAVAMASLTWSAYSQSPYFQAVTNLNPVVYFPLQEITPPPIGDVETNYGSLGHIADAVYQSTAGRVAKQASGATSDGDTAVAFGSSSGTDNGGFIAVPITDVRTGVTNSAFTVECWVNSANAVNNFEGIVCKAAGNGDGIAGSGAPGTIYPTNNLAGFCLSQNYIAAMDSASERGFDFHVYNGVGHSGAEVVVPYSVTNGSWYHLVATFDGVNCGFYVNGQNVVGPGLSGITIPMQSGTHYVPDTFDQLQIGASRNLNANRYEGSIDEVAIYTNVLSAAQVAAHYAAATTATYSATIANDHPIMYYRMDSTAYTAPDPSTYPVAADYGLNAANFTGSYGPASTPGRPGPQLPGMLDPGNGNSSYGMAVNGLGGNNGNTANVPIGYTTSGTLVTVPQAVPFLIQPDAFTDPAATVLYPTNRNPFSISIWFQSGPYDWNRFATIFGHSDNNYRLALANGGNAGRLQFAPGAASGSITGSGNDAVVSQLQYDDNNWHHFVGVYDGTNELLYVDGRLDNTRVEGTNWIHISTLDPVLGGDPQYITTGNIGTAPAGTLAGLATGYNERFFSGNIAHFAFFTNALTASNVFNLYTNATGGIGALPAIVSQPFSGRTNPAPGFLFFGTVAIGSIGDGALSYQWYFNSSSNYTGATQLVNDGVKYALVTTSQMVVSNLAAGDSGYYFVVVTNNVGSVTSSLASLYVNYSPVILSQVPAGNFSLFPNQAATLSVSAISTTNLLYQWYVNGAPDPAGTNATYVSAGVTTAGTSFYCIVSNSLGTATSVAVSATSIVPLPSALTNSPFGSNILALNPTAYWPMHESSEPAAISAAPNIETNYGSLGAAANGEYGDWRINMGNSLGLRTGTGNLWAPTNLYTLHNIYGAIAGDSDTAVNFFGAANNQATYVVIPHSSPKLTLQPPFTLEAWVRPEDNQSFGSILAQDSGVLNSGQGPNNAGVFGGFNWIYSGTANTFSMPIRNINNPGNYPEPKTSASYPPGQWYHVVTTFDGSNVVYYINGVQDVNMLNSNLVTYYTNSWDPITIGCARGEGANYWRGSLDEIAVYSGILPVGEITKHYNDGTNSAYHNYMGDVLADNPLLYYRMDAPQYTAPAVSGWPTLTNYGSVAINGVYTPNSVPGGGAVPSRNGSPIQGLSANNSFQQDGVMQFADAGDVPAFNPTGKTPFTAAAWVKGNPLDASRGWQGILGHGDSAWRLNIDGGGTTNGAGHVNFNAGPGGGADIGNGPDYAVGTHINPIDGFNDGNWHYVVGTFDGSNSIVYVDGLVSATNLNTSANITSQSVDVFLGAYPNNTVYGNTFLAVSEESGNGINTSTGNASSGNGRVLAGAMCEAAFWNGQALTPSQIQTLFNAAQVSPDILIQPISGFANQNGGFTNLVAASGSGTLSYQWYKNGQPMPVGGQTNFSPGFGPTSPNLIIYPITTNDQSLNYYVVVTNNYGSVTSAVWSINPVFTVPVFTNDIVNTNYLLYAGGHANFKILAVGAQPVSYRWYSNNVVIPGATSTAYNLVNAQPPGQTNIYYCVASNFVGVTTSSIAVVDIIPVPAVIPYSLTVMTDNPTGFWPMDETNGAIIALDYAAGNDGIYTNANQGQPGFNSSDTNRTSVQFGATVFNNSDIYGIPNNVDFSMTNGGSSNFSVECWAKGFQQTVDAGIVAKGYGGGGEQFNLDCGSDGTTPSHSFRFFFRDASGATHAVNSTNNPSDGLWHHLAAVCNETNGQVILYIDGLPAGTNTFSPGLGVLTSTYNMSIGARDASSADNTNSLQFVGYIQDVAVYNYALSQQQVLNHYFAADIPATVVHDVADETACQNGVAMFTTTVLATPPVGYQWYDVNTSLLIPGATNTTLFVNNVQNGDSYYLVATNNYGTNQTRTAALNVITGPPQFIVQPPASTFVPKGDPITIPVTVMGTLPMTNQWQMSDTNAVSWTNLTDNVRVSGSQQIWLNMTNTQVSMLTINPAKLSDAGDYQLITGNSAGSSGPSVTANVIVGTLPIGFNGDGVGWDSSQAGTYNNPAIVNGVWEGTEAANGSETRSFFFTYPQYIGAFTASFSYQDIGGGGADGVTFCIQNDPRGPAAIGGGGGSFAVSGITPSWELELNIYSGTANGLGYNIFTNGNNGANVPAGNVSFASGDPININMLYLSGRMTLMFTDTVTTATFTTNFAANIPATVNGQTAYIGFTAADGGTAATQVVTNFVFASLVSEALSVSNGTNAVISWNGLIAGYTLEQSGNLTTPNWVPVPYADIITNGLHKVTVPTVGTTNLFYRLNSSD